MNLETALAKIMWIMGEKGLSFEEIKERFYTQVELDLLG